MTQNIGLGLGREREVGKQTTGTTGKHERRGEGEREGKGKTRITEGPMLRRSTLGKKRKKLLPTELFSSNIF